jgi:hypothetical protein
MPNATSLALMTTCLAICGCGSSAGPSAVEVGTTEAALQSDHGLHVRSSDFAHFDAPIAGVAGDSDLVFVGEPLDGNVVVLSRHSGKQLGLLPAPPEGFAVPFIMHVTGEGHLAVLGAGGLPQPAPFVPASPFIYEYSYTSHGNHFSASLDRVIDFSSALIGFSEDFARLDDGRYLVSDAVLGSIWVVERDGSVQPGIVPKTFDPENFIPQLALCPTMPEVTVNGYPFLFTGSTIPGVSPIAVRHGTVYYFSPCARGIYAFPLRILNDHRQPYERAADIRLVAATPADVEVEELLDFTFNPFDDGDDHLYAADPLALSVIRVDIHSGRREVLASGPTLFDFPSSLGFLPTDCAHNELVVVSNQQERTPLTNDAVTETTFNLPFIVSKIRFDR